MFKIFIILIAIIFALGIDSSSAETEKKESEVVYVGNKTCVVAGEKINDKMKATYEYEGKIYNFCCAMCIDEFKKDPEKYIKELEKEIAEEKNLQEHSHSSGEEHHYHSH